MQKEKKITIFYSWQSDSPKLTNLNAIRQSIRIATNILENEIENIFFNLDEATRNVSGSPNIPLTIFEKIQKSDIFICDLTTINTDSINISRKTPNPNVLIELGYAISQIGWNRIIMLFNTNIGSFNDLPFDIDRHRASSFKIIDKNDKEGKNKLVLLLKTALKSIIKSKPKKPFQNKDSKKELQKNRDIYNLKLILDSFHFKTFDIFLDEMPSKLIHEIFYYKDTFDKIYDSSDFYIYDKKLELILKNINFNWGKCLSFPVHYDKEYNGDNYKFYDYFSKPQYKQAYKDYEIISNSIDSLKIEYLNFLKHIRNEYLEIDLKKQNIIALKKYNNYRNS